MMPVRRGWGVAAVVVALGASLGPAACSPATHTRDDAGTADEADNRDAEAAVEDAAEETVGEDDEGAADMDDGGDAFPDIDEGCPDPAEMRPFWERSAGDEWCITPTTRDLALHWSEPTPGCEQVTYAAFISSHPEMPNWDVWDGAVVYGSRGLVLVDAPSRTERILIADQYPGPRISPLNPRISADVVTFYAQGYVPDAPPMEHYIIRWSRLDSTLRLVIRTIKQTSPYIGYPGSRPCLASQDVYGTIGVFDQNLSGCSDCAFNSLAIDLETSAETWLTTYAGGGCYWDTQMWGNQAVISFVGAGSILLVDVTAPEPRVFAPSPGFQWHAKIHENTVCWVDLREGSGDPMGTFHNSEIYCAEIGVETASKVSDEPDNVLAPDVFGDWIAWGIRPAAATTGNSIDIHLHSRSLDRTFDLRERLGTWDPSQLMNPRVWGDYIYFQVPPVSDIHRCHLPTLFPEAY